VSTGSSHEPHPPNKGTLRQNAGGCDLAVGDLAQGAAILACHRSEGTYQSTFGDLLTGEEIRPAPPSARQWLLRPFLTAQLPEIGWWVFKADDYSVFGVEVTVKAIVVMVLGALSLSTPASAQTAADTVKRALAAARAPDREAPPSYGGTDDGSYDTIKKGTNRWVCWDVSGRFHFPPFASMCTSIGSLESNAQFMRFLAKGKNNEGAEALRAAARADGSRVPPEYGSVQRMLAGAGEENAQAITLIWLPHATPESIGLPISGGNERARLSLAGTADAHIVVP
jgi:hypothetical protein